MLSVKTFNRTSLEWKLFSTERNACALSTLLIEPVWNGNLIEVMSFEMLDIRDF